jgi:P-type Ca2+ transporter type 2C
MVYCFYCMDEKDTQKKWYKMSLEDICTYLTVSKEKGLSRDEREERQKRYGKNALEKSHQKTFFQKVLSQFESPLVLVLLIAGIVTLFLQEYFDSIVIFIALFINLVIGLFQEERASRAFEKLNESQESFAIVLREGKKETVSTEDLLPGDVVFLESGFFVPADIRLFEVHELRINEAALTGEWLSVQKEVYDSSEEKSLAERKNMAYMGTLIESGHGKGLVVETGLRTELGEIAHSLGTIAKEITPLQKNIKKLAIFLTYIIFFSLVIIFILGFLRGQSLHDVLFIAIAVAVSTMPSGLPPAVTVVLAVGMEAILKRGGLVRNLLAAETLGATTVILTDKTGTLTEAKMKLAGLYSYDGIVKKIIHPEGDNRFLLERSVLQSDAYIEQGKEDSTELIVQGRPIEKAVLTAGLESGIAQDILLENLPRVDYIPFSSERRFGVSLHKNAHKRSSHLIIGGEPEKLLNAAPFYFHHNKKVPMTEGVREKFFETLKIHASQGERLIGVAFRECIRKDFADSLEKPDILLEKIVFVGFIGFEDPVRNDVSSSIQTVQDAHARVIMLTGDNPETAHHIAQQVGIVRSGEDLVIKGSDIEALSDDELYEKLQFTRVIARAVPAHKLRIAEVLKAKGEVVAMTGDGINDAPALRSANIGVAVASGTEVAKESSDLILMSNSFSIIVSAIEEGRRIIDNLKKILAYLLSTSFSALLLIIGALITGSPLPLLPAQILWANIVGGDVMSFAFAFEKSEKGIMRRDPRKSKTTNILTKDLFSLIILLPVVTSGMTIAIYYYLLSINVPIEEIRTIMFVAISLDALFFSFSMKSLTTPIWKISLFSNKYLLGTLLLSLVLLFLALSLPALRQLLSLTVLNSFEILLLVGLGVINLFAIEFLKWFIFGRKKEKEENK